jgi:transcriptional regulator GlxA family with amidase domain
VANRRAVSVELLASVRRARDHIDRHYRMRLDLDGLALIAGLPKFNFIRSFEAAYGLTPIRYLIHRRIERAQDLLRTTNLPVTDVCMLVGYASLGSFSSRFTEVTGESPSAYRNRWADRDDRAAMDQAAMPDCYRFMGGLHGVSVAGH